MAPSPQPLPENARQSARREFWAAGAAMFLFLCWLFFPLASGWLHRAPAQDSSGAQKAAQRPVRNGRPLADFLRDFSEYFEKSSPMRPLLIPKYTAFKLYVLGVTSVSSVIVGRDHWLFLGKETDRIDERRYFMGAHPFQESDLEQWRRVLTERERWLKQRGIAYLLVAVPNKSTVYPEHMPAAYPRGRSTRLDQLYGFIKRHAPDFPLLDLRPAMLAGKKKRTLYWPTDTHWNDFGLDLAYRQIVRQLAARFPSLQAIPEDAFEARPCPPGSRDLEKMLLLPWKAPGPFFHLVTKRPLAYTPARKANAAAPRASVIYHYNAAPLPLALIVHDSFGESLKPILGTHFRRSKWVLDRTHAFPAAWIEKKRPSVVIEEMVERYLEEDPWTNPVEIGK